MQRPERLWPIDPHRQFDLADLRDLPATRLRTGADGEALLVFRGESAAFHNSLFAYRLDPAGRMVELRPVWPDASSTLFDPARSRDLDGRGPLAEGDAIALSDLYGPLAPATPFGLLLVSDGFRRIGADHFGDGSFRLVDVGTGEAPGPGSRPQDLRLVHEDGGGSRAWSGGLWFATDPAPDDGPGHSLHPDGVEHVAWAEGEDGTLWLAFEDLDTRLYDIPARNFIDLVLEVRTTSLAAPPCPLPLDADHLAGGIGSQLAAGEAGARFGLALTIGDFDGDGRADLAVGAPEAADGRGQVWLFVGFEGRPLELDPDGTVILLGDAAGDQLGTSLAAADVDGDGRDELLVGAIGVDGGGPDSGAVYVVEAEAAVDGAIGAVASLRLDGLAAGDELGRALDGGGDIDGDGFEDVVAGARLAEADYARYSGGLSYVLFGGEVGLADDLAALDGDQGFRIEGGGRFDQSGRSVALVGDVNGDGLEDLAVGVPDADPLGRTQGGEVLVVFGDDEGFPATLAPEDLADERGVRIAGPVAGAYAGFDVAAAGDVDGDGFDDLLIGTYGPVDDQGRGAAYVVYGREDWPDRLDLADGADADLTRLVGPGGGQEGGLARAVAGVGDVDGDGFDDVVLGARYADRAQGGEGIAYLVWGRDDRPAELDLEQLEATEAGCRLLGTRADGYAGFAFAGPGDIDGDGLEDVVLSAPGPAEGEEPGRLFVVYGREADDDDDAEDDGDPAPLVVAAPEPPPPAPPATGSADDEPGASPAADPDHETDDEDGVGMPPTADPPPPVAGSDLEESDDEADPPLVPPAAPEPEVTVADGGIVRPTPGFASLLFGDIAPAGAGWAARFGLDPPFEA